MLEPSITLEAHKLTPDSLVHLLTIDSRHIINGTQASIVHLTNTPTDNNVDLTWRGNTHKFVPYIFEGAGTDIQAGLSRPTLSLENVTRVLMQSIISLGSLSGSLVTVTSTYFKYLDNGVEPNPIATLEENSYIIYAKSGQSRISIKYILTSMLDRPDVELPSDRIYRDRFPGLTRNRVR